LTAPGLVEYCLFLPFTLRAQHDALRLLTRKTAPMATTATRGVILIRNGRVYDQDGDVDLPRITDLLIVDGIIGGDPIQL